MERSAMVAETEVDYEVVLRFDAGLASLEPEEFVERILRSRCQMTHLIVGHDHGFGRGRSGDLTTLRSLGAKLGFGVEEVGPVGDGPATVSSSAIRRAVEAGDLRRAAEGLGRPYLVSGQVQVGDRRGRTIGVPTVNVAPPVGKLLPPDGVYAVRVEWGGGVAGGMMNQGGRPTVGDGARWLEAHLFDFDRDLYGREIRIEWVSWLRPIQRFESLDALRRQLGRDREAALGALDLAATTNDVSAARHAI
jgi:riboflavin kinase/FMN adenylyltransferase